jgi:hypothetical protein
MANRDPACIAVGVQNYTYQEFPEHMVWVKSQQKWKPRDQGAAIGWMYFVSPNAGERFYLQTLLTVIRGVTLGHHFSYIQYSNYHIRCNILGRHPHC